MKKHLYGRILRNYDIYIFITYSASLNNEFPNIDEIISQINNVSGKQATGIIAEDWQ